jgi:peptide/nickel transport system permease protein
MPSVRTRLLRRFLRNRAATGCLALLVFLHLAAFVGPSVYTASPYEVRPLDGLISPSLAHPLGTDESGRDVLARLLVGARISLAVGWCATLIAGIVGTGIGIFSGYFGGRIDALTMRLTDAFLSLPTFFLLLIALAFFGGSILILTIVIGVTSWMGVARVVRSEVLRSRSMEFIAAAHALGATDKRIMLRHILPQTVPSLIVAGSLGVAAAILTEAAMSFLGLGVTPPTPSWGNMLMNSQRYIYSAPLLSVYPGLLIFLTVLGYNFLGDGLRDALDPYSVRNR